MWSLIHQMPKNYTAWCVKLYQYGKEESEILKHPEITKKIQQNENLKWNKTESQVLHADSYIVHPNQRVLIHSII